jgi:hypothetical protein
MSISIGVILEGLTHAFVLTFPKEYVAQRVCRRRITLVAIKRSLDQLGTNHELLYPFVLSEVRILARIERVEP